VPKSTSEVLKGTSEVPFSTSELRCWTSEVLFRCLENPKGILEVPRRGKLSPRTRGQEQGAERLRNSAGDFPLGRESQRHEEE
jgi:hypothetical protein